MNNLKELLSLCKCQVSVTVNDHRNDYHNAKQYLDEIEFCYGEPIGIEPDVLKKMIKLDTVVCVRAYNETAIGFYESYHYDMDTAIKEVLKSVKGDT